MLALLGVRGPRLGDSLVIERLRGADNCCRLEGRRVWLEGVWFEWVWSAGLAAPLCDGVDEELDGLLLLTEP